MKKLCLITFILFYILSNINAQETYFKIDSLLNNSVETGIIPHVNIILIKDGNTVLEKPYGFKDISRNEEMNLDHIFRLSSLTKLVTSVAVMQLVDAGKINLSDPIEKYLPEFNNITILDSLNKDYSRFYSHPSKSKITIHHLLSNTSGFAYGAAMYPKLGILYNKVGIDMGYDTSNITLSEKVSKLASIPIKHEPGESWTYGFNYDILGCIVEKATGMGFDRYLAENLFTPLQLRDTYFYIAPEDINKLVPIHLYNKEDNTYFTTTKSPELPYRMPFNYPVDGTQKYLSGGVGLSSSIKDYINILQMLYNDGIFNNKQILSKESVQKITSNQIGELPFMLKNSYWGYGNIVEKDKSIFWSEGGGFNYFKVNKEKGYILILFTQTMFSPYSTMKLFFKIDDIILNG